VNAAPLRLFATYSKETLMNDLFLAMAEARQRAVVQGSSTARGSSDRPSAPVVAPEVAPPGRWWRLRLWSSLRGRLLPH
jgi:hypothetical protein